MENISVAEAKSRLSELISRAEAGERFVIRRRERPVAVLLSVAELERLERSSKAIYQLALALGQSAELLKQIEAGEVHPAMAVFGLWAHKEEFTNLTDEVYANRERQGARAGVDV